jgi:hypothetical protein
MHKLHRCLLVVLAIVFCGPAHAAMVFMKAPLAPDTLLCPASVGTGSAFVTLDTTTHMLTWAINYRNLPSGYLFSHFHGPVADGGQAGVQVTIDATAMASPIVGSVMLDPVLAAQQEADLLAGKYYINLHTLACGGGDIRGTVVPIDSNFYDVFTSLSNPAVPSDFLNGVVSLDPATLMMNWFINWGTMAATMPMGAGFHGPDAMGADMVTIATGAATPDLIGSMMLTPAQAAELVNGLWSFQVDTAAPMRVQLRPSHPRLANISTRAEVLTGSNVLIAGFVIGGSANKTVAITATGPSLIPAGIPNALANPKITVVRSVDQTVIANNDDFRAQADGMGGMQFDTANLAMGNMLESAVMLNLPPGAYTAIVEGVGGGTGVGLVAVYEVDHHEVPLINISTRAQVLTGNDVVIAGFIIQGSEPKTVVVTGVGPALVPVGIPDALMDPMLTLVRSSDSAVLATNDDWQTAPNAADLVAVHLAPTNAKEPAIMMTLPPGAYTAILSGVGGSVGVGIVAVWSVQ